MTLNTIRVSPWRRGYVRLTRASMLICSAYHLLWNALRKVIDRYVPTSLLHTMSRKHPYEGIHHCDGDEVFIDLPIDECKRQVLVADLEVAGFNVIDERERSTFRIGSGPYRRPPYNDSGLRA